MDLLLAIRIYVGVFTGVGIMLQGFPLGVAVMFGDTPDVTALVLLVVSFCLFKAVVDACLGLLATRTTTSRAP